MGLVVRGWSFGAGLGLLVVAGDLFENSAAGFGISAIVLGAGVVGLAHFVAERYAEPDEMEPGPSRFTPPQPPAPPAAAWAGHPGAPGHYPGYPQPPYPPPPPPPDT